MGAQTCWYIVRSWQRRLQPERNRATMTDMANCDHLPDHDHWNEAEQQMQPCLRDRVKYHFCCWAWKLALVVPAIHVLLHVLGLPHPEFIAFIP